MPSSTIFNQSSPLSWTIRLWQWFCLQVWVWRCASQAFLLQKWWLGLPWDYFRNSCPVCFSPMFLGSCIPWHPCTQPQQPCRDAQSHIHMHRAWPISPAPTLTHTPLVQFPCKPQHVTTARTTGSGRRHWVSQWWQSTVHSFTHVRLGMH